MDEVRDYRSTSQRRAYRRCGYLWLQHYQQGWRPSWDRGTYQFGHVMENLAVLLACRHLTTPDEAAATFGLAWALLEHQPGIRWTKNASWGLLRDRGKELAKKMAVEIPRQILPSPILAQETINFELIPGVKERAVPDLYCLMRTPEQTTAWSIIDFKTSGRRYHPLSVELDEQLTDYELAERYLGRPVDQVGLCVLIYTAEPQIQWLMGPARPPEVVARFVDSAVAVDRQITAGVFIQNDKACLTFGECPMMPLCYASQRDRIPTELVRTKPEALEDLGWDDD